jgi:cysteine desulfurase
VVFHPDAVQAVGKIPTRLRDTVINFLSLSAHKFHGPKGVGALYVNRRTRFHPLIEGGGQENGRRGGTENVASIVGLGKAAERAAEYLPQEQTQVGGMRDRFEKAILQSVSGASVNGARAARLPTPQALFEESIARGPVLDRHHICCRRSAADGVAGSVARCAR